MCLICVLDYPERSGRSSQGEDSCSALSLRHNVDFGCSRCIAGALNGNVGVLKSVIGEITDNTNMAQAFALIPVAFTVGASIAPLYGGSLGRPHDYWPVLFSGSFWVQYPYFLPCVVSASFAAFSFFITALFLKESLPLKRNGKNSQPDIPSTNSQNDTPGDRDTSPVPTLTLLKTYSVMLPIANYGVLALVDIGLFALVPVRYWRVDDGIWHWKWLVSNIIRGSSSRSFW